MELFKPVDFDFIPKLVEFTVDDVRKQFGELNILYREIKFSHCFPEDLLKQINSELTSKGWPEIWYTRTFIRPPKNTQVVHIDGFDEIIHAAINIPVTGCINSKHVWKIGKFNRVVSKSKQGQHHDIMWLDNHIETVELTINRPHLLRVDLPHYAVSNESDIRQVLSLRFKGNPSYETLSNLILPATC